MDVFDPTVDFSVMQYLFTLSERLKAARRITMAVMRLALTMTSLRGKPGRKYYIFICAVNSKRGVLTVLLAR